MTVLHLPNRLHEIPTGHLTGPDLAARADISYRQLDHWTRTGRLTPASRHPDHGSGYPRHYPPDQVTLACLMARLTHAGLAVDPAHTIARQLLDHGHARLAGIRIDLPQDL